MLFAESTPPGQRLLNRKYLSARIAKTVNGKRGRFGIGKF
jgi:hypothetical protein